MKIEQCIETLKELWRYKETDKYTEIEIREALDLAIEALEQEPKTGHWIDRQLQNKIDGEIRKAGECSKCHSIYFRYDLSQNVVDHIPNYCPHCGARMESDSE